MSGGDEKYADFLRATLYEREGQRSHISSLTERCRQTYLDALRLVKGDKSVISRLSDMGWQRHYYISSLFDAWEILNERYILELYDPQLHLLYNHQEEAETRWSQFYYWDVLENISSNHAMIRDVLHACRILGGGDQKAATVRIETYFSEMEMPESRPAKFHTGKYAVSRWHESLPWLHSYDSFD